MANELSALAEVLGDVVDRVGLSTVETMHRAVARRVFAANGPMAVPVRMVHDGVATGVYSTLRRAAGGAMGLCASALRSAAGTADVRPLSRSALGRHAIGGINGIIGDRLAARGSDLAVTMAVRRDGADVACTRAALARAFPKATPRVAVFLHGLAETDEWWTRRDLGMTAVYLRYNTGLHVSENGALLAELLDALVGAWPVPVERLALVGHSMGGLVVRAACHAGGERGQGWTQLVRSVVTLGTPHHGAPLEKAVHAAAWALRAVPETGAFADILDQRSAGIRDLCFGALHDEDWRDADPRRLLVDSRRQVPLLPHCRHTFITATLTRDPAHPLGRLVGDLLVRTESAGGRCGERSIPLDADCVRHLGGLSHFDLLGHPEVDALLREALQPR